MDLAPVSWGAFHNAISSMCSAASCALQQHGPSHHSAGSAGPCALLHPAAWIAPTAARHRGLKGHSSKGKNQQPAELTFTLHSSAQPHPRHSGRHVVRMPLPWASITGPPELSPSPPGSSNITYAGGEVPRLLSSMATGKKQLSQQNKDKDKEEPQERILISEVEVIGVEGPLLDVARAALRTRPNFAYTFGEVRQDVGRVFSTGWFRECVPDAVDTRDGVKLIIKVTPNDEVRGLATTGSNVLPPGVVQDAFKDLQGRTLNYVTLRKAVNSIDDWYSERGFLGQVTDFDIRDGVIQLECAEAVVDSVKLQFLDTKTQQPVDNPRTRQAVITRHITTKPGQVYNLKQANRDIAAVYATGLFEEVNILPKESDESTETAPKLDLTLNLVERKTGGLGAGGGLSTQARREGALPGFVGSFTYSERNLFGLNQKLHMLVELGQVDKIFKIQHTDPWLLGDPHRTSRTIQLLNNRNAGQAIHGPIEVETLVAGQEQTPPVAGAVDNLIIGRLIGSVEYARPLPRAWQGALGLSACRTTCLGGAGGQQPTSTDCYGAPLTISGEVADHMAVLSGSATYSPPESGGQLQMSVEQGLPLARQWLRFTRLRLRLDKPIPLVGPLLLYCRAKAGAIRGDLPPYEAFPIGGSNSVRGYADGGVGTGRHFMEATAELQFPLAGPVAGCVFTDWGSDLNSGASVIGNPAGARGKPGHGYAYGAGVRVDTPVGPLRLEYAWNGARKGRFHVGVGHD